MAALAAAALPVAAMAAEAESVKYEESAYFGQYTFGVGVHNNFTATIVLPGNKWRSPITITALNAAPTDMAQFAVEAQHLVPIQAGDPVPGPNFEYFHRFTADVGLNGDMLQIFFAIAMHGSGADAIVGVSTAKITPTTVDFFFNSTFGFHGTAADTVEQWLARLQNPSNKKGLTHAKVNRHGKVTIIQCAIEGVAPSDISGSGIHLGTPQIPGPRILETGGSSAWRAAGDLGSVLLKPPFDIPEALAQTIHEQPCFFQVDTGPLGQVKYQGIMKFLPIQPFVTPTSFSVIGGLLAGGTVQSLANIDGNVVSIINDEGNSTGLMEVMANIPGNTFPEQAAVRVVSRATRPDLLQFINVPNIMGGPNANFGIGLASTRMTIVDVGVIGLTGQWITPGAGTFRASVQWIPITDIDAADGWAEMVDQVGFGAWDHGV